MLMAHRLPLAIIVMSILSSCGGPASFRFYDEYGVGFVNKSGRVVIPAEFDDAEDFSDGLALVASDGLGGWIDRRGNIIIPLEYYDAGSFSQRRAMAVPEEDGLAGYLD
ncbi:MAG: WG repeat-containing protein, partial [Spirochaetaceae bacterium]|nr:WG repeat-containing protein [Spirochaetaceae bacterium]